MHAFYAKYGITHQTYCTYTPEQNGIVEHKYQHILNVTRALLFQANLPYKFLCFTTQHAILLINCIPTSLLKNDTYEHSDSKCMYLNNCDDGLTPTKDEGTCLRRLSMFRKEVH